MNKQDLDCLTSLIKRAKTGDNESLALLIAQICDYLLDELETIAKQAAILSMPIV